jgi:hypothetical protein
MGFSFSTPRERPFFAAELVRATTSFGGYQLDLHSSKCGTSYYLRTQEVHRCLHFTGLLQNFMYLRQVLF